MGELASANLFLEVVLLDSKSFSSNECFPRKSSETRLQLKIFHVFATLVF